ncbi:MAG: hypothetical protein HY726_07150 [Candidatus Rokubacteria bacterium]|nr:hypothetical protein [Candidatus Rokubacteria bacterium]
MVIGAMAVAMWGQPRATADIDFTVLTDPDGLDILGRDAEHLGFLIDQQWLEWHPLQRGQQIRLKSGDFLIDIVRPMDQHQEEALRRSRALEIGGRNVWFASPEDLILMKLKAGRPRDFEDAISVLARQRDKLDERYMTDWAWRIGAYDELAYILRGGTVGFG